MLQRESFCASVRQAKVTSQLVDGQLREKLPVKAACPRFFNKALGCCDIPFGHRLPLYQLWRSGYTFGTEHLA